jgi:hypothetical protein
VVAKGLPWPEIFKINVLFENLFWIVDISIQVFIRFQMMCLCQLELIQLLRRKFKKKKSAIGRPFFVLIKGVAKLGDYLHYP